MTREEKVKNLLTELINMIDNGSQRDLDRADEIGTSIIKLFEQEPFINKPCVSSEVCEHDKQKVLDKIRAEIEEPLKINQGLNTENAKAQLIALSWVLEVIDKYKSESEG